MLNADSVALPLRPMPTAVADQQGAVDVPCRPRHSDAFTHQPFVGLLGHMNSTFLLQTTEAGVAATQISPSIRCSSRAIPPLATGIPVARTWEI